MKVVEAMSLRENLVFRDGGSSLMEDANVVTLSSSTTSHSSNKRKKSYVDGYE